MNEELQHTDQPEAPADELSPNKPRVKSIEVDDELMDDIREFTRDKAAPVLLNIVTDLHPADIADIVNRLGADEQRYLFELLDPETASEVLVDLEPDVREHLLKPMTSEKISSYVDLMPSDDAADVVAELPPNVAATVLRAMPAEESSDVKELMQYGPETAGGIMGTEYVAVNLNDTVAHAVREVRKLAKQDMQIHTVFVIDEEGLLVGYLPLQSLVL